MAKQPESDINCAKCNKRVCPHANYMEGPENCPTKTRGDVVESMMERYHSEELSEFARVASIVQGSGSTIVPWSSAASQVTSRLEDIIRFAALMKYKKLGVAFCAGLAYEAEILIPILEKSGFEVVSVGCKVGGIAKEKIGIKDSQKVIPGRHESMCNPITQAEILNREEVDFNIMMGLCVGHDSLFLKQVKAPTTVFAVKDPLLGHNPLMALYMSHSFFRRINTPDLAKKLTENIKPD